MVLAVINYLIVIVIILQREFLPVRHVLRVNHFLHLNFCNDRAQGRWIPSFSFYVGANGQPTAAPLSRWDEVVERRRMAVVVSVVHYMWLCLGVVVLCICSP
jgi:hypothetical protein